MEEAGNKKRRAWILGFTAFVLLFVVIPVTVMTGFFTFILTKGLMQTGHPGYGIKLMYGLISIFTVVFGINVIPEGVEPIGIFVQPPGAFLVIALFIAIMNAIGIKTRQRKLVEEGCDGCCSACSAPCEKNEEVAAK